MSESEADAVYDRYRRFLREVYEIWDASVALAVDDFERRERAIERFQLANYTRHEAKCRLKDLAGTEFECSLKELDNNGIEITFQDAVFKVFRSNGGQLHFPRSDALGDYFEQGRLQLVDAESGAPVGSDDLKLVIGWDFDFVTRSLESMDLRRPGSWARQIDHPADFQPDSPGGEPAEAPDLDLELGDEDEDQAEAEGGDD